MEIVEFAALGSYSQEKGPELIQKWPPDKDISKYDIFDILLHIDRLSNEKISMLYPTYLSLKIKNIA